MRIAHPAARALTRASLAEAVRELCRLDPDLAAVVRAHGPPPLWARRPGFPTLVRIILEQQVSLASARAAYVRLAAAVPRVTPEHFLTLDGAALRAAGFSRQKAAYCRELAATLSRGEIDLTKLARLPDDEARAALCRLRGVGAWTADIYLLMALRRPDVWPTGDLALARAAQTVKRLRRLPDDRRLARLAAAWKPHRAVAARLLWHDYLSRARAAVGAT